MIGGSGNIDIIADGLNGLNLFGKVRVEVNRSE